MITLKYNHIFKNNNFELNYYFFFILKNFPTYYHKNFLYIKYFLNSFRLIDLNKKISNTYNNYKLNYTFESFKSNLIENSNKPIKFNLNKIKTNSVFKFFNLIFLFNLSMFNTIFRFNHNFKLFYLYETSKQLIIIDSKKFINRWKDSYDLIYNIFFYNYNPLIFSTKFFKNETLAINWNYNFFDINLWNYFFPFFVFKLNKYTHKSSFFFDKLNQLGVNFFLITDCTYHFKNIHYMRKNNYYTIGLVNVNLNPWIVSYPIISFFDSFITQSFFFKFLITTNKLVNYTKFNFFKKIWYNLKLK